MSAPLNVGTLGALNEELVTSNIDNFGTISISVSGTWSGGITLFISTDGSIFDAVKVQAISGGPFLNTITANGQFLVSASGVQNVKAKMTSYSSGSAFLEIRATSATLFQSFQPFIQDVNVVSPNPLPVTFAALPELEIKNDVGNPVPISGQVTANAGTNLNTSLLALESTQVSQNTLLGPVAETSPATDTAPSGLNGRLQRIAQRLTSIFTALSDGTQLSRLRGGSDGTTIGNVSDRLKVIDQDLLAVFSPAGSGAPTLTPKLRHDFNSATLVLTASYQVRYSYSGAGKFVSLALDIEANTIEVKLEIDGNIVFETTTNTLIALNAAGNISILQFQTSGDAKKMAYAPKYPIVFSSSVVLSLREATGKRVFTSAVSLTKET